MIIVRTIVEISSIKINEDFGLGIIIPHEIVNKTKLVLL